MSLLDRAIVKAFQRRRDSDAVAKTAAVECCAVEPAPDTPVIAPSEPATSRAASVSSSDEYLNLHYSNSIPVSAAVPEIASSMVESARESARSKPLREWTEPPIPPTSPIEPPQLPTVVRVQTASGSTGRATYTSNFERTPDPVLKTDSAVGPESSPTVGYTVTAMPAVVPPPPPPPPVIERPVAQQWKWPEICEQLDQFTGEGFRQLAKHLQFAAEQGHKSLAFVSSASGAGRTSVLLTLTRILALEGKSEVLLIDADRRHPQLASLIASRQNAGLREVLHGQLRMDQAVVPMLPGRVSALPLNDNMTDNEWLKLVAPMRVLLKQARRDFDMILIDAGVLGPETTLSDCWLRGAVDAVITISRQLTDKRTAHEVLDWKQIGIESLGVIETFA